MQNLVAMPLKINFFVELTVSHDIVSNLDIWYDSLDHGGHQDSNLNMCNGHKNFDF